MNEMKLVNTDKPGIEKSEPNPVPQFFCNRQQSAKYHFLSFFRQNVDTKVENPKHPKEPIFSKNTK